MEKITIYDNFLESLGREFDILKELKAGLRGSVSVVRHKQSGSKYIFRHFAGNGDVYKKLLIVASPHLPQIMEAAEQDGKVIVLEEFVQGDTLDFILEGGLLTPAQAKKNYPSALLRTPYPPLLRGCAPRYQARKHHHLRRQCRADRL